MALSNRIVFLFNLLFVGFAGMVYAEILYQNDFGTVEQRTAGSDVGRCVWLDRMAIVSGDGNYVVEPNGWKDCSSDMASIVRGVDSGTDGRHSGLMADGVGAVRFYKKIDVPRGKLIKGLKVSVRGFGSKALDTGFTIGISKNGRDWIEAVGQHPHSAWATAKVISRAWSEPAAYLYVEIFNRTAVSASQKPQDCGYISDIKVEAALADGAAPEPGYQNVGIYSSQGGWEEWFDIHFSKSKWANGNGWTQSGVASAYPTYKINIVELIFSEGSQDLPPIETAKSNLNKMMDALNLKAIYAVTLAEERGYHAEQLVLSDPYPDDGVSQSYLSYLYDHIKAKYGQQIRVYQWLSYPLTPPPQSDMKADGYVYDCYTFDPNNPSNISEWTGKMQAHLDTGKPLIACLWASPYDLAFGNPPEGWVAASQKQMEWCRAKNVPIMLYAIGYPNNSPNEWHSYPGCQIWRDWVFGSLLGDTRKQAL